MERKPGKKKLIITLAIGLLVITAGIGVWYWKYKPKSKLATNIEGSSKTASQAFQGSSNSTNKPSGGGNTNTNNNQTNSNLPTPVLIKSAGNNGSVPKDVNIDFTCYGPTGFSCQLSLKPKSGTTPTFDKKTLNTDSRGQNFANWEWKTVVGSWQAQAILYNSSGQSKASEPQSFEVK